MAEDVRKACRNPSATSAAETLGDWKDRLRRECELNALGQYFEQLAAAAEAVSVAFFGELADVAANVADAVPFTHVLERARFLRIFQQTAISASLPTKPGPSTGGEVRRIRLALGLRCFLDAAVGLKLHGSPRPMIAHARTSGRKHRGALGL